MTQAKTKKAKQDTTAADPVPGSEAVCKQKKKRGRKAAVKYFSSSIRKQIPLSTVIGEKDDSILHLDIKDSDSETEPLASVENLIEGDDITILLEEKIKLRHDQDQIIVTKLEELSLTHTDNESTKDNPDNENDSRIQGYFSVLGKFYDTSEWLKRTDVWCWWCCHPFETVPLGLPIHYDEKIKRFRVKGVFCSFSCMVAYRREHNSRYHRVDPLIKSLHKQITGALKIQTSLNPAPPRCALECFGGKLSISDFREVGANGHKVLKMVEYPMFISRDYIEEIDIKNVKNANANVFVSGNPKLRLQSQIDKTTVLTGNTIDKFISEFT